MLFLDNQQRILNDILLQVSGEFLMELREEEDFIKETVVNRVDLLSKLEQSLKQSVGSTGSAAGRNTLVGSVRSIGSLAGKSIGSNVDHNETILGIKNEEKRETKTNMEPANVKKERSVPKLSKAPSEFQPLVTTNPIQQSLAELRKGIFAANVKKNQNRTTNILADLGQEAISRQNSGRVSTDLTQFENLDNQRNSGLDQIYVNGSIPDLLDISLNLDQDESMVLDTPKQQAQYRSPTTKILNTTPKQTIDIPKMQPLNDTPKQKQFAAQVSKSTPLKNEILPKSEVQTAFKKPHTEALDAVFKSPFKSPQNIYKGQAKSFLPQNQPAQEPESDKPLYSFLQGVVKKPVVKPKIEVKSLQLAQAAAKRERLEKERKQKLKEEREQRTKKMLEDRKLMEKTGNDVSKKQEPKTIGEVKKHDLKPDLSKKPEPLGLKRPAEYQGGQIKKTMKLQSPTKMIKKIKVPLTTTTSANVPSKIIAIKNPILAENKPQQTQTEPKATHNTIVNNGEIQGIEDDTESDHDSKYKKKPKQLLPTWAQSPILAQSLKSQQLIDPDTIFQDLEQPNIQEIMGTNKMRASVAGDFYSMESLSTEEQLEYKATMGYNQI